MTTEPTEDPEVEFDLTDPDSIPTPEGDDALEHSDEQDDEDAEVTE